MEYLILNFLKRQHQLLEGKKPQEFFNLIVYLHLRIFLLILETERERGRVRERDTDVRKKHRSVAS